MIEIIILELISLVSFIYAILLIFVEFIPINQLAWVFIWTAISAFIVSLSIGKSQLHKITIFLLLAPLLLYRDFKYILLILTATIIIFIYIQNSLQKGRHLDYLSMFKRSLVLYIVLLYIRILSTQFNWFLGKESIFLIIYLLSSIVLIRSIRHLDTNMNAINIKNSNRKYLFGIVGVFIIGTFESISDILFKLSTKAFEMVEYLLYILLYPLNKFLFWFFGLFEDMESVPQDEIIIGAEKIPEEIIEPENLDNFTEYVQKNFLILKILTAIILFIVVIYILYKLLSKTGVNNYICVEYTEHREFIRDEKKKKRRLFGESYPKDPKEQIRYYYRKFLGKLNKEDIKILNHDTSLDISIKAKDTLGSNADEIRNIYIDSRYGNKNVNKDDVELIKGLYKNL